MAKTKYCKVCGDEFDAVFITDGVCRWCARKKAFATFAESCGLSRFPDPTGERYVYNLDGECTGKKSENIGLIDSLWNALVEAKGGDASLMLGEE